MVLLGSGCDGAPPPEPEKERPLGSEIARAIERAHEESAREAMQRAHGEPGSCRDDLPPQGAAPDWRLVRAGAFQRTVGEGRSPRTHEVRVSRDFMMMTTEVTLGMWRRHVGPIHGSEVQHCCRDDCPVTGARFWEVLSFANAMSSGEGREACYDLSRCPTPSSYELECDYEASPALACEGYRLPTEAEWELAARAGARTRFYCGDSYQCLRGNEWLGFSREMGVEHGPGPVATLHPNPWGLYDMFGNVSEYVWDRCGPELTHDVVDPIGPDADAQSDPPGRTTRGLSYAQSVNASDRGCQYDERGAATFTGFRLVRTVAAE